MSTCFHVEGASSGSGEPNRATSCSHVATPARTQSTATYFFVFFIWSDFALVLDQRFGWCLVGLLTGTNFVVPFLADSSEKLWRRFQDVAFKVRPSVNAPTECLWDVCCPRSTEGLLAVPFFLQLMPRHAPVKDVHPSK